MPWKGYRCTVLVEYWILSPICSTIHERILHERCSIWARCNCYKVESVFEILKEPGGLRFETEEGVSSCLTQVKTCRQVKFHLLGSLDWKLICKNSETWFATNTSIPQEEGRWKENEKISRGHTCTCSCTPYCSASVVKTKPGPLGVCAFFVDNNLLRGKKGFASTHADLLTCSVVESSWLVPGGAGSIVISASICLKQLLINSCNSMTLHAKLKTCNSLFLTEALAFDRNG